MIEMLSRPPFSSAASIIASIAAPLIVPVLFVAGGMPVVFGVFSAAFAIAAIAGLLLPEMKGRLIG